MIQDRKEFRPHLNEFPTPVSLLSVAPSRFEDGSRFFTTVMLQE